MSKDESIRMNEIVKKIEVNKKVNLDCNCNKNKVHSTQDYVKKLRKMNEDIGNVNLETIHDQPMHEANIRAALKTNGIKAIVEFIKLKVTEDYVFWGGTIDNIIYFTYSVTDDEGTSGVKFKYPDPDLVIDPENDEITKVIEDYYEQFYKWAREIIEE